MLWGNPRTVEVTSRSHFQEWLLLVSEQAVASQVGVKTYTCSTHISTSEPIFRHPKVATVLRAHISLAILAKPQRRQMIRKQSHTVLRESRFFESISSINGSNLSGYGVKNILKYTTPNFPCSKAPLIGEGQEVPCFWVTDNGRLTWTSHHRSEMKSRGLLEHSCENVIYFKAIHFMLYSWYGGNRGCSAEGMVYFIWQSDNSGEMGENPVLKKSIRVFECRSTSGQRSPFPWFECVESPFSIKSSWTSNLIQFSQWECSA